MFLAQVILPFFTSQSYFLLSEDLASLDGSDSVDPLQPSGDPAPDSSWRGPPSLTAIVDLVRSRHLEMNTMIICSVRRWVESLGDSSAQLLDLLSAQGDEIEPTRGQNSSRQALYPEVGLPQASCERLGLIWL